MLEDIYVYVSSETGSDWRPWIVSKPDFQIFSLGGRFSQQ